MDEVGGKGGGVAATQVLRPAEIAYTAPRMDLRSRRWWAAIAAWAGCSFAACSLGVDFDQYTNGNGAPDSGPAVDSAPDTSSSDIDAGFCPDAAAVTLCDDFDGHHDAGWMTRNENGGSVTTSTTDFVSAPHSLLTMRPEVAPDAGISAGGSLFRYIAPSITTATIEADVKPCTPTSGFTNILAILDNFGFFVSFGVAFDGSAPKTYAFASNSDGQHPIIAGDLLATDRFSHVKWTIEFHRTAGRMRVEVDGKELVDLDDLPTGNDGVTQRAFQIGAYGSTGSACTVNVDNVMLDAR